tara:strand:- start:104 stop:910 length:807 start_codon:yes stop_codon:yes gene_type:complete
MALFLNRARETSTTTGTGTLNLDGAVAGARTAVAAALAADNGAGGSSPFLLVRYLIQADDGATWETGEGTLTDAATDTLSRTTVIANSDGTTTALNLGAGTKTVVFGVMLADDITSAPPGLVQLKYTQDGTLFTGSTAMVLDNTKPQNTEGTEWGTIAITPTNSANLLRIRFSAQGGTNAAGYQPILGLFQDSTVDAICARSTTLNGGTQSQMLELTHIMVAGTTSATTFKIRAGAPAAAIITINGYNGVANFNGVANATLSVEEITV